MKTANSERICEHTNMPHIYTHHSYGCVVHVYRLADVVRLDDLPLVRMGHGGVPFEVDGHTVDLHRRQAPDLGLFVAQAVDELVPTLPAHRGELGEDRGAAGARYPGPGRLRLPGQFQGDLGVGGASCGDGAQYGLVVRILDGYGLRVERRDVRVADPLAEMDWTQHRCVCLFCEPKVMNYTENLGYAYQTVSFTQLGDWPFLLMI